MKRYTMPVLLAFLGKGRRRSRKGHRTLRIHIDRNEHDHHHLLDGHDRLRQCGVHLEGDHQIDDYLTST